MPETREVPKKAADEKDTDKVKKLDDQPSCFFRPDDPLIVQYEESKEKFKEAVDNVSPDEEERQKTVRAMRSFAKKKSSTKIIKK